MISQEEKTKKNKTAQTSKESTHCKRESQKQKNRNPHRFRHLRNSDVQSFYTLYELPKETKNEIKLIFSNTTYFKVQNRVVRNKYNI